MKNVCYLWIKPNVFNLNRIIKKLKSQGYSECGDVSDQIRNKGRDIILIFEDAHSKYFVGGMSKCGHTEESIVENILFSNSGARYIPIRIKI